MVTQWCRCSTTWREMGPALGDLGRYIGLVARALKLPPHAAVYNMTYIDAGDFDANGTSEVLFWFSGYNNDGYVLFTDNLKHRVEFTWHYH